MQSHLLLDSKDGFQVYIRKAVLSDLFDLVNLSTAAFANDLKTYGEGPVGYDSVFHMKQNIIDHYTFLIYKINQATPGQQNPIGGIVVRLDQPDTCHLSLIFFNQDAQGLGIGRKSLLFLRDNMFKHISTWEAWTVRDNSTTKKFYEGLGFVKKVEFTPKAVALSFYAWKK